MVFGNTKNTIIETGEDMSEFVENLEGSEFYRLRGDQDDNSSALYTVALVVTSDLMAVALTCTDALVAHGCLDNVMIGVGEEQISSSIDLRIMPSITEENDLEEEGSNDDVLNTSLNEPKYTNAVTVIAKSIFLCYLDWTLK